MLDLPAKHRVVYRRWHGDPMPDVLTVVRFSTAPGAPVATPCIDVALQPLSAPHLAECWLASGAVSAGRSGSIRYACDDQSLFAVIELDERQFTGIDAATEAAYREIAAFQQHSGFPWLLRMWNTMDAINEHTGGLERYRQFCVGRARAWDAVPVGLYPAASCVGRQHLTQQLQIYWLASRAPADTIENPRQMSAYHYPREYGPTSPSFSRAALASGTMFISGTASIVGHVSLHRGDPVAQAQETLRNLDALAKRDAEAAPLIKVYVRDPAHLESIRATLGGLAPADNVLYLAADLCREELLLEIEGVLPQVAFAAR